MSDNPKANDYYINGMFEFLKDNFAESIQLLSQAIEQDTHHKLAYMSRGSAFLRLDRPDEAIADFDRAIHLNPDFARSYHLRGLAKEKQGTHTEAIADFDKAIDLDAWVSNSTWEIGYPRRLVDIAYKLKGGYPLTNADMIYLCRFRKREQKRLFT